VVRPRRMPVGQAPEARRAQNGPRVAQHHRARFPRKLCATDPAMFLTALLVVDAQRQAQVAPRTLAARGCQRADTSAGCGRRFPDRPRDRCDRGRLGARAEKSRHSYVSRWFCGRVIPFFADACRTRAARPDHPSLGGLLQTQTLRWWRLPSARPLPSAATQA
jgi:hypothetical protein